MFHESVRQPEFQNCCFGYLENAPGQIQVQVQGFGAMTVTVGGHFQHHV